MFDTSTKWLVLNSQPETPHRGWESVMDIFLPEWKMSFVLGGKFAAIDVIRLYSENFMKNCQQKGNAFVFAKVFFYSTWWTDVVTTLSFSPYWIINFLLCLVSLCRTSSCGSRSTVCGYNKLGGVRRHADERDFHFPASPVTAPNIVLPRLRDQRRSDSHNGGALIIQL